MTRYGSIITCLLTVALFFSFAGSTWSQQSIKTRMRSRISIIKALKANGIVGENNMGYLAILKHDTDKKDVISAENQDRRTIYSAIAKKEGTTPKVVGQRRALQIARKAPPGTMIQDAKGGWHKK